MNNTKNSSMKMRVPGAKQAIDKMKYEIANEFGVSPVSYTHLIERKLLHMRCTNSL